MPPTPMQVKRTLDNTLLDAGVKFLYGCYATDVLTDAAGRIAGIVMANRAGRQAVKAKVIIDATPRATVTAMAGLADAEYPPGLQKFERTTVGGKPGDIRRRTNARSVSSTTALSNSSDASTRHNPPN